MCCQVEATANNGLGWVLGVEIWVGMTNKWIQFWVQAKIYEIATNWNHFWGWFMPPRSKLGFNLGPGWHLGSEIHQMFSSWSSLGQIQSTIIDENDQLLKIIFVVIDPT